MVKEKLRCLRYASGMQAPCLCFTIILIFLLPSCSLKYSEPVDVGNKVPEFIFEDTSLTRYEADKPTLEFHAELLEQYKNSSESYAKGVQFKTFDKEGKVETEGNCGLLSADTDRKQYALFDDISVNNNDEKMKFSAESLYWNAVTEQLVSGRGDMVKVEKDDITIRGTGFAASGISREFSFTGNVIGNIETKDNPQAEEKIKNENENSKN